MKKLLTVFIAVIFITSIAYSQEVKVRSKKREAKPAMLTSWSLTEEQMRKCFNFGCDEYGKGRKISDLSFTAYTYKKITNDIDLHNASLRTPAFIMLQAGWTAEHSKWTQAEKDRFIKSSYPKENSIVEFGAYLTSSLNLDPLYKITFAAETDKGVGLKLISSPKPNISVGSDSLSSWYNAFYHPQFSINGEDGKPALTEDTKWLKLYIISPTKRVTVKFWLDDSFKTEVSVK